LTEKGAARESKRGGHVEMKISLKNIEIHGRKGRALATNPFQNKKTARQSQKNGRSTKRKEGGVEET